MVKPNGKMNNKPSTKLPDTVKELLGFDAIQGIVHKFMSEDIANTSELVLIFKDKKGNVWIRHSCNELTLFGLIGLALKATLHDDD